MPYRYDRRFASSLPGILRLIVQGVLRDRSVERLVEAYNEEAEEDLIEEGETPPATEREKEAWEKEHLGIMHSTQEVERFMQDTYITAYTKRVPWANRAQALEVFDYPRSLPSRGVPKSVAEAVALALASQDAEDAVALHEMALSRQ